jgi:thiol-disulfide isomerase/thioredoxin
VFSAPHCPTAQAYEDRIIAIQNDSEKLRLINVWATWCGPCIAEFDELVNTYRMYQGRDFEMYTISTDKPEIRDKVKEFLQKKHMAVNILHARFISKSFFFRQG